MKQTDGAAFSNSLIVACSAEVSPIEGASSLTPGLTTAYSAVLSLFSTNMPVSFSSLAAPATVFFQADVAQKPPVESKAQRMTQKTYFLFMVCRVEVK